ncbi:MAG TPA: carboxypeptidase-like regulatory domain-containing protein, partial [Tenuifilaceae bacterium]|nr:carboxypeptidase-like regulatory domain-containing protein [Tenuifilaceae bacterium]
MKKLCVFLAGLLLVGITMAQAQTVRITGTVTSSEDGMPMPGVSVIVPGTTIGASTNIDGKYEINVPTTAASLSFSFVGYATQEVAIAGRSVIDVVLKSEAVEMEEVVVTALGIKREKREVTY